MYSPERIGNPLKGIPPCENLWSGIAMSEDAQYFASVLIINDPDVCIYKLQNDGGYAKHAICEYVSLPRGLCWHNGNLFICELRNKRIVECDVNGVHKRYFRTTAEPFAVTVSEDNVIVTSSEGALFVFSYSTGAEKLSCFADFRGPCGASCKGREIFVTDYKKHRVVKYDLITGEFTGVVIQSVVFPNDVMLYDDGCLAVSGLEGITVIQPDDIKRVVEGPFCRWLSGNVTLINAQPTRLHPKFAKTTRGMFIIFCLRLKK